MLNIIAAVVLALCIAGMAYSVVAIARAFSFARRLGEFERGNTAEGNAGELPPVTILKPLAGVEPGLRENLRSFCIQDYPQFQVVFGVREAADPGAAVVRSVIEELKGKDLTLVVGADPTMANAKVGTLVEMASACKYGILIVADSDTNVTSDYLRAVVAPFGDTGVGGVTCLYRGRPSGGLAADLGTLMIDDQFMPSVLVAAIGRITFCLGATMAVRKQTLEGIGGFAALGPYLADDRRLGELVASSGARVAIAPHVVEHDVIEPGLSALWAHEVRWARTNRLEKPWGFAGYFITYPLPLALLYLALSQNIIVGVIAVFAALALRVGLHYAARASLRARSPDKPWLIPLRDFLGLAVWAASLFGRHVRWRGRVLTVDRQGRIVTGAA